MPEPFFKKETLTQVLSCEFCKISKSIFCHRTPLMAASDNILKDGYFSEYTHLRLPDATVQRCSVKLLLHRKHLWQSPVAVNLQR